MSISHETTKAIERHLRILGYSRGTVEWDGALAAARAHAERSCDGEAFPVTIRREDAQRIFDVAVGADSACSGYMETDDVHAMRRLAVALGVDPNECTPDQFASQYPHPHKRRQVNAVMGYGETGEQAQARIARERADQTCWVGTYGRRCGKSEDDPIHAASEGAAA